MVTTQLATYPSFPGRFEEPSIRSHKYIDPTEPLALAGARVLVALDEALAARPRSGRFGSDPGTG